MKAINQIARLFCLLTFFIVSNSSQAQCPSISSNLGCQVDGTVDIYTYVTPPSGPCNSAVCNSYPFSIPANGFLNLNCSGCLPVCNVVLTITDLNGTPLTTVISVDFSTTTSVSLGSAPPACSGTGFTNYVYDPSTNSFKIFQ